jgi:hypothetical protein
VHLHAAIILIVCSSSNGGWAFLGCMVHVRFHAERALPYFFVFFYHGLKQDCKHSNNGMHVSRLADQDRSAATSQATNMSSMQTATLHVPYGKVCFKLAEQTKIFDHKCLNEDPTGELCANSVSSTTMIVCSGGSILEATSQKWNSV